MKRLACQFATTVSAAWSHAPAVAWSHALPVARRIAQRIAQRIALPVALVIVVVGLLSSRLDAEDVVHLRPARGGDGAGGADDDRSATIAVRGEIVDYTGEGLLLRAGGREQNYPAARVERIESDWSPAHEEADAALAAGDLLAAFDGYQRAHRGEERDWVRRRIEAQLVWCHRACDRSAIAGDLFLRLLADDPQTVHLAAIPLAWFPSERVPVETAQRWLSVRDAPAAALLGASHLLSGPRRADALAELERLARDGPPPIDGLAEAQLWRPRVGRADEAELGRWEQRIARLPAALRAGPWFVLGRGHAANRNREEAALAFLRVPILQQRGRDLAAAALLEAGDALLALERRNDAARLYAEVVRDYRGSPWQSEAEARQAAMHVDPTELFP